MTIKDKMKTYNFWISLVSAIVLLLRIIGDNYGFNVDAGLIMDLTTGVCGIFVILGIISVPQKPINELKVTSNKIVDNSIAPYEKMQNDNNMIENQLNSAENIQNIIKENICPEDEKDKFITDFTENKTIAIEESCENFESANNEDNNLIAICENVINESINDAINKNQETIAVAGAKEESNCISDIISSEEIVVDCVNKLGASCDSTNEEKVSNFINSLTDDELEILKNMI